MKNGLKPILLDVDRIEQHQTRETLLSMAVMLAPSRDITNEELRHMVLGCICCAIHCMHEQYSRGETNGELLKAFASINDSLQEEWTD